MDSSGEEDEEEFFESLEDIPSTSSGEEEERSRRHLNESQTSMVRIPNGQMRSQWSDGYEIWKSNPDTLPERRQRLRSQMGLKPESEDTDKAVVPSAAEPAAQLPSSMAAPSTIPAFVSVAGNGSSVGRSASEGLEVSKTLDVQCIDARWTMARSRSDGTFCRLQTEQVLNECSVRLVRSGSNSPLLPGHERLVDNSGAVLRTGSSGHGYPASKPPLGVKRTTGTGSSTPASRSFTVGKAARRSQSYWSNLGRVKVLNVNGTSPLDTRSLDGDIDAETLQRLLGEGRYSIESSEDAVNLEDGEVLCRIKDLDSGKEFVVNEVGKDGMWNKLKELDTGRELTLEEFESSLGLSPIVQEVMRRERAADDTGVRDIQVDAGPGPQKKKKGWLKVFKGVVRGSREKGNRTSHGSGSDDKEGSTEKTGRSGSATDDSQDSFPQTTKRIKVHAHRKAMKEFADLHTRQEIQAHQGAIWTMKFSLDGFYLASAGQDRIVRVWEVLEQKGRARDSPDTAVGEVNLDVEKLVAENGVGDSQTQGEVKKSGKGFPGRKKTPISTSRPPKSFLLSEHPKCAFEGHTEDVLDLSWSPSQSLLSSSMDKTVRLWNVSSRECLRIFTHNDYVTCIQFNPVNDGYFISGSLDEKVRIWSIQDRQVVDWADLREMVTAACYTPDGQGAVVGSYKGMCRHYKTSGNKLQLEAVFDVRSNKGKRSRGKKITGFQFIPGDHHKVLITSSDSRIRVYDGTEISSKYKGFRNTNSQISASFSANGRYIICASEDSRVCIWNYNDASSGYAGRRKDKSGSYEEFSARHVLVAIPWPGMAPLSAQLDFCGQKSLQKCDSPSLSEKELSSLERKTGNGDNSPVSISSGRSEPDLGVCSQASSFHREHVSDGTPILTANDERTMFVADGLKGRKKVEVIVPETHDGGFLACNDKTSSFPGGVSSGSTSVSDSYLEDSSGGSLFSKGTPPQQGGSHGFFSDSKGSATWPEEKLPPVQRTSGINAVGLTKTTDRALTEEVGIDKNVTAIASAWGLVIVTAGLGGEIRTFQNYSLPVRL